MNNPDRTGLLQRIFSGGSVFATARRPIARRWATAPTVIELPPLRAPSVQSSGRARFPRLRTATLNCFRHCIHSPSGKRTTVVSSNDRNANQETNFLSQRIESFTGICILTTNHDTAIDEAFLRRLAIRVRFPLPHEDEREKLWRAMIPVDAPTSNRLDLGASRRST